MHKVDDILGITRKLLPQFGVVRRDADGARVKVADAHHDAAQGDERRRGKAVFLGAQERCNGHGAACHQLAVRLNDDPVSEIVQNQRLMRLRQSQFPGQAGMAHARPWRGARAAVVSADQNDVREALGDTGGNRADARLGDKLDVDPGRGICIFQVVNQFF